MDVQQKSSTKNQINIGIEATNRDKICQMLQQLMADEHILYIKTRNYHWNVQGIHFNTLHGFFEEQYTDLAEQIDEIAERTRSLGFFAKGSMDDFIELARLEETDHLNGDATQMLKNLLLDHETIIQILRHDLEECENLGDMGTSDFLTGLMEAHEKMAWMLRSHLA